jgi:hypothetical protein
LGQFPCLETFSVCSKDEKVLSKLVVQKHNTTNHQYFPSLSYLSAIIQLDSFYLVSLYLGMLNKTTDYDAIVIGAGFSGIRSLWELVQLGLTVRCFDTASDVGGTWYWNRYPGARTDSDAWVYHLNFASELVEEWDFHERCPSQEEIQRYLSRVVG